MKRHQRHKEIRQQRRQDILNVATKVFARRGYHGTDIEEIADLLKIGKGTIYRYFKTKQNLFVSVVEDKMDQFLEIISQKLSRITNPLKRIREAIKIHLELFENNIDVVEVFIQARSEFKKYFYRLYLKHYQNHLKRLEDLIKDCIRQRLIKPTNSQKVIKVLSNLYYGILFVSYMGENKSRRSERKKYILDIFLKNILVPIPSRPDA